jgi:hypothetical protein
MGLRDDGDVRDSDAVLAQRAYQPPEAPRLQEASGAGQRQGRRPEPSALVRDEGSTRPDQWSDPAFRRQLAWGKLLGPAIIIIPLALVYFWRALARTSRVGHSDSASMPCLALLFAVGAAAAIIYYARKDLNRP